MGRGGEAAGNPRRGRRRRCSAAAIWLLFLRGGDDAPTVEAGSRFGVRQRQRLRRDAHGHARAAARRRARGPRAAARIRRRRRADEVARAPQDAVAGLFLVGFKGTNSEASFFKRLKALPYGGVLLTQRQLQRAAAARRR